MLDLSVYREAFAWLVQLKKDLIKARSLEYILVVALTLSVAFGVILYIVDPNIGSLGDGIWYAWVTMTHVGYGDVVPVSLLGRLLGTVLIVFGIGMFALFTASLSAALIGRDLGDVRKEVSLVGQEAHDIEREESLVLKEIARLNERLAGLEAELKSRKSE